VDLLIGPGSTVLAEAAAVATGVEAGLRERGYAVLQSLEEFQPSARRAIVLLPSAEFDLAAAVRRTIAVLSRNPKGYFLMVECDLHTDNLKRGLDRALLVDGIIEETARRAGRGTLIVFTADHSFDTRVKGGRRGDPLLVADGGGSAAAAKAPIRVDGGHTGEEVLVAAQGPGAERVRGFFPNTQLFHILMAAYGWK
jgi:alkaline phosphatase